MSRQRNSEPQIFCDKDVIKWQSKIESSGILEEAKQLFQTVLTPPNQLVQLKAVKQVGIQLQKLSVATAQAQCCNTIVHVLVEMHSCCSSRHPLQRTISSVLQNLPATEQLVVVKHVSDTLEGMLCVARVGENVAEYFTLLTKKVQYIEALMENFHSGESALKHQLPLALEYLSLEMVNCSSHGNRYGVDGLVILLKITMNTMQKFSPIFRIILNQNNTLDDAITETFISLSWPCEVMDQLPTKKKQWTELQLSKLTSACEEVILEADVFLHDATVTAAMLSVTLFNVAHSLLPITTDDTYSSTQLQALSAQVDHWLALFKPFPQLAVCYALLAKLPTVALIACSYDNKPLLVALFPIICKLFNCFTESSDRYIGARTLALWTSVAGDCIQGVISEESPVSLCLLPSGDVVQTVLQYIWSLWEDPIDGIRHQCKDMFQNIIKIYKQLQGTVSEDLLLSLAKSLVSFESPTRGKYILLSTLSQHISAKKLLEVSPQLPSELMDSMGHQALACHAGELWSRLVSLHWQAATDEEDEVEWSKIWVSTLVETMHRGSTLARRHITQYCLQSLFQNAEKTIGYVLSLQEFAPSSNSRLTTQLACLRCARLCGDFSSFGDSFTELFKTAMLHSDEQICLSALFLVCETHRTTEPPEPSHLSLLLQFVEINANSQSPGFRYPVLNAFKKLFIRIRDSSYSMLKMHQKGRIPNPDSQIDSYKEFILTLMMQLFKELHPLSSFQRRNFSLSLLQLIAAVFDQPPEGLAQQTAAVAATESQSTPTISQLFDFSAAVTEEQTKRLLEALHDPYDANRSICLQLLLKIPNEKIGFHVAENVSQYSGVYFRLVGSPKSASCAAGAFHLRLLLQKCCTQFNSCLQSLIEHGCDLKVMDDKPPFCQTIALLCKLLEKHMAVAKEDLVTASMVAPMYGVLHSIRTVWEVELSISHSSLLSWLPYLEPVEKVVELCSEVARLVSPVVCSSSPEGFLPDSPHSEQEGDERQSVQVKPLTNSASTKAGGTAQSLLLCCWHSMKEIALLLGYLVENAPVTVGTPERSGVLTHSQLDTIAGIFIHQLTEARHRGAFEMAYTGFSKLCRCLWSSSSPELKTKPSSWVQELLDSLQSTSLARLLSITRRSAGLPFYIQAILTAEPAHTGRTCFKRTMKTLLQIARESGLTPSPPDPGAAEDQSTKVATQPAAVHALNILRALFRDSRLGEIIVTFIPDAVEIAIEGFSASLWPVRNSSTLLFSALISRLFGAKRVQDEHSMENKMTAREFFTRFPTLHGFIQKHLSLSVEQLTNKEAEISLQPTLFPVLLLLSRLYPSPLDETNSPTSLQSFLPLILSCTTCSVWKTRVLACSVLVSILSEHNITSVLEDLYQGMELHRQNQLHGHLLVVEKLLSDRPKLLSVCQNGEAVDCILFKHHLKNHWIASSQNTCGITRQLYLEIFVNLFELVTAQKALPLLSEGSVTLSHFLQLLGDCNETLTSSVKLVWLVFFADSLLIAQLKLLLFVSRNRDTFDVSLIASQPSVDDILTQTLQDDYSLAVRTFSLQCLISYSLSAPQSIRQAAVHVVLHETDADLLNQAYKFIGKQITCGRKVDKLEEVTEVAFRLCLQKCNRLELKLTLIELVTSVLASMDISSSTKYLAGWLSYFEECCVPTQPFEIRTVIASMLSRLLPVLKQLPTPNQANQLLKVFCQLVVTLLQDADGDVRLSMATEVVKLLPGGSDVYPDVESPNSPTALKWFISSLPTLIKDEDACFNILLSLLPHSTSSCSDRNNPLFDEDPLNDYAEDLVVLNHVTECIDHVISKLIDTHRLSKEHIDNLAREMEESAPFDLNGSVWHRPGAFLNSMRRILLSNIFKSIHKCLSKSSLSNAEDKQLVTLLETLSLVETKTLGTSRNGGNC